MQGKRGENGTRHAVRMWVFHLVFLYVTQRKRFLGSKNGEKSFCPRRVLFMVQNGLGPEV